MTAAAASGKVSISSIMKARATPPAMALCAFMLSAAAFAQSQPASPAGPSPEAVKKHLDSLTAAEKFRLFIENNDLSDLITAVTGLTMIFAILIFSVLFLKRWNVPRMGYFLVTLVTLASRAIVPEVVFWNVVAFVAGIFSIFMFFSAKKTANFDSKKEPLFFLFNAFSLLIISFTADFFYITFSGMSLATSLFFLISKSNTPHGKFKKHDADEMIIKSLQKRAGREL